MNTFDIIKSLCKTKGISISSLEKDLGYGNGSLGKAKVIPSDRVYEIAKYFNVYMEYLMGEKINETYYQNDNTAQPLPRIMEYYNQLNDLGKSEATKRVEELTYFPNYTSSNETDTQGISFNLSDVPDTFEEKIKMMNNYISTDVG